MNISKPLQILIAEDDDGHALLIKRNLQKGGVGNSIKRVGDGQAALDFINEVHASRDPISILLLLDLNMPVLNGYEVLSQLKQEPHTQYIPVVVLTSTDDPSEIDRCYELGCNVYIRKPVDYDKFSSAIQQLGLFLSVVEIPSKRLIS